MTAAGEPQEDITMLHSVTDLLDTPVIHQEGRAFLRDLYFEPSTGQIRLVAVETGHPERIEALIDATRLSTPVTPGGDWTLGVTPDDLAAAPSWPEAVERGWLDPHNWPLILIGPFASPFVPALALSGLGVAVAEESREPDDGTRTEAERLVAPLERVGDWIGAAVFGWDGELGQLRDLLFEPATRTIRDLKLEVDGRKERATLPFTRVRHRAENGAHLVVDARHGDLREPAPS